MLCFMSLLPFFNSRYSCKLFDTARQVPRRDIEVLIETARLAPSALGLPVVRLIQIKNVSLRDTLRKHSLYQSPITDASDMFVFAVKTEFTHENIENHILHTAQVRKGNIESLEDHKKLIEQILDGFSPTDFVEWSQKQAYIALGFMLTQCAVLWVDACPIGLFDSQKYDELLDLKAQWLHATIVLTVWYRSPEDICQTFPKVRTEREEFFLTKI